MATVTQANYNDRPAAFVVGQIVDMTTCDLVSRFCEPASIAFGKPVIIGTDPKQATIGAAGSFVGITVEDKTLLPDDADTYVAGGAMAVLIRGTVAVVAGESVVAGDPVYRTAAGVLNKTASGNTLIANAIWETTTANAAVGVIRIR